MAHKNFSQSGIALPMVLVFLVLMMLIGAVAIRNVTLDEKMAANSRNHQLAFQAAESGLRYCETGAQRNAIVPKPGAAARQLDSMITAAVAGANAWDVWPEAAATTASVSLPAGNGTAQCIIEDVTTSIAMGPTQTKRDVSAKVYRVTAFGVDTSLASPNAKVILQSYLKF